MATAARRRGVGRPRRRPDRQRRRRPIQFRRAGLRARRRALGRSCCAPAARRKARAQSNIRWNYGHTTIPRHLRDIIVTEYGIADIRGKSDRDVIAAMLAITDSRFQDELLRQAKDAGKIERSFELAQSRARQHAGRDRAGAEAGLRRRPADGRFRSAPISPRSSSACCRRCKRSSRRPRPNCLGWLSAASRRQRAARTLDRLGLAQPKTLSEWLYAALVRGALSTA